jgi:hypothetical protein
LFLPTSLLMQRSPASHTTSSLPAAWALNRTVSTTLQLLIYSHRQTVLSKMLPPTDSLRHPVQKLAEAHINNRSSSAAPPPYSSLLPSATSIMTPSPMIMDDPHWEDPSVPITITIDSTIDVLGNNNTVMLPSRAGSPKHTTPCPSIDPEDSGSSGTSPRSESALLVLAAWLPSSSPRSSKLVD